MLKLWGKFSGIASSCNAILGGLKLDVALIESEGKSTLHENLYNITSIKPQFWLMQILIEEKNRKSHPTVTSVWEN